MNLFALSFSPSRYAIRWITVAMLAGVVGCLRAESTPSMPGSVAGKSDATSKPPAGGEKKSEATVSVSEKISVASQDEAKEIAQAIDAAISHQNPSDLSALIDQDQFADRILAGLPVPEDFRISYRKQITDDGGLANVLLEILEAVNEGGDYSLIRILDRDGVHHPVFRLLLPDGRGFNHHEIVLNHDRNGKPKIVDIFVFLNGEQVSDSLRSVDFAMILQQVPTAKESVRGVEESIAANLTALQQIQSLAVENKGEEALTLFDALPEDLRTNKRILMTKLGVAQKVGDEAYFRVLEEFQKQFPTEPAFLFRMLDMLAVQQRHEDVLQTADLLQSLTGDAYLNLMKVNSLLALDRPEDARTAVSAAKKVSDSRVDIYWVEMSVLLKTKDYAAVAKQLDEIATRFGMKFNDLSAIPDYAEFVASNEGKAWLEAQKNKPAESVPDVPTAPNEVSTAPGEVPPAPK